ncbi:type II toxin-antitoxin system VapC family toxin [Brevundimonas sp.]|uniref:type II toxin-antitoxin system VapC family toxin n=1 Tax=Brevundimonas sp. TaxID=1871086 RepID=UPI003563656E
MRPILVDSNVILDIAIATSPWREWSEAALKKGAEDRLLIINPMIYAEVSVGFLEIAEVDALVDETGLTREDLPWSAAFLAGKAFKRYRSEGGERHSPLPDFFIGAHATVRRYTLLTRDARRYRSYFPSVDLICPDSD